MLPIWERLHHGALFNRASMENVRQWIGDAFQKDPRFKTQASPNSLCSAGPWIADIEVGDDGQWDVVFMRDGKHYRLGFTLEDDSVRLSPIPPEEVSREVVYNRAAKRMLLSET
jgi:hypothetical protein